MVVMRKRSYYGTRRKTGTTQKIKF